MYESYSRAFSYCFLFLVFQSLYNKKFSITFFHISNREQSIGILTVISPRANESGMRALKLVDSPVSGRGRSSLDAGRGSTPYSKVVTSPARASTTSTTEIGSNDVRNTVLTDVRPMSVIFRRAHVQIHSSALGLRAAVTARRAAITFS